MCQPPLTLKREVAQKNPSEAEVDFLQADYNVEIKQKSEEKVKQEVKHRNSVVSQSGTNTGPIVQVCFGSGTVIGCLVDSGAELTCLDKSMLDIPGLNAIKPNVSLCSPLCSCVTSAKMVSVLARLVDSDTPVHLMCAITDQLNGQALLSLKDYEILNSTGKVLVPASIVTNTGLLYTNPELTEEQNKVRILELKASLNKLKVNQSDKLSSVELLTASGENKEEFVALQRADESLKTCWMQAKSADEKATPFLTKDDVLYHRAALSGFEVDQLVVPTAKRQMVLDRSHCGEWASHFSARNTQKRLSAYFYWPKIKAQVQTFVTTCELCQKERRKTKADRVPIKIVERPEEAFSHVAIDVCGPFDPKSSAGHAYILVIICLNSRWMEAIPLKDLSAKSTCDALLEVFTRMSVPRTITSDNATNFIAALSHELFKRLGIEIRHATPFHPMGNAVCERSIADLKRGLHKVFISDKPRRWHKLLPYIVWSHNELPHSTTGLSPHHLVFGRIP